MNLQKKVGYLADQHFNGENASLPLLLLCQSYINISFIFFTLLVTFVGFIFRIPISSYHIIVSLILSIIVGFFLSRYYFDTNKILDLKYPILWLIFLLISLLFSWVVATNYYDTSWDGQHYHQGTILSLIKGWNPLFEKSPDFSGYLWINHYPKAAGASSGVIIASTGHIEDGKLLNILLIITTFLICLSTIFYMYPKISPIYMFIFSILLALNPISICQSLSYCVDGQMASLLTIFVFLLMRSMEKNDYWLYLITSFVIIYVINIKFTGIIYIMVLTLGCIIFSYLNFKKFPDPTISSDALMSLESQKRSVVSLTSLTISNPSVPVQCHSNSWSCTCPDYQFRHLTCKHVHVIPRYHTLLIISLLLGIMFGYNPYLTNTIEGGNPFYPLIGGNIDIITWNTPTDFFGRNQIERFFISIFSESSNDWRSPVVYKLPFTASKQEIDSFFNTDNRIGGFGPLFSGIFILSAILIAIILNNNIKKILNNFALFMCFIIFLTVIINPDAWWARYVPQLWIIPILLLLYSCQEFNKRLSILSHFLIVVMMVNILIIAFSYYSYQSQVTEDINSMLDIIKNKEAEDNEPIKISYQHFPDYYFNSIPRRFTEHGINYIVINNLNDNYNITMPGSWGETQIYL
jgi:hypothetical protein